MAALLEELSNAQREVIVLRILDGCTTSEAAELMGTDPHTVSATLYRALTRLRELLDKHGIESTLFRPL